MRKRLREPPHGKQRKVRQALELAAREKAAACKRDVVIAHFIAAPIAALRTAAAVDPAVQTVRQSARVDHQFAQQIDRQNRRDHGDQMNRIRESNARPVDARGD